MSKLTESIEAKLENLDETKTVRVGVISRNQGGLYKIADYLDSKMIPVIDLYRNIGMVMADLTRSQVYDLSRQKYVAEIVSLPENKE